MCGRFNLRVSPSQLAELFDTSDVPDWHDRYNIAPTQYVPIAHLNEGMERLLSPMRWGLIPSWAKDAKIGNKLINARSETVAEKPSFRAAFKRRRCLVPASGFYEWDRRGKSKIPFHIHREDDSPFSFAGLWETWHENGSEIESFTILTTAANDFVSAIHDRMPVIISSEQYSLWLDSDVEPATLHPLMEPAEWEGFEMVEVSKVVNNVRNEGPECLKPAQDRLF